MRQKHIGVVEGSDEDFATLQGAAQRGGMSYPIARAASGVDGLRLPVVVLSACASPRVLQEIDANWLGSMVLPT
jgi:hypothetical protein